MKLWRVLQLTMSIELRNKKGILSNAIVLFFENTKTSINLVLACTHSLYQEIKREEV